MTKYLIFLAWLTLLVGCGVKSDPIPYVQAYPAHENSKTMQEKKVEKRSPNSEENDSEGKR